MLLALVGCEGSERAAPDAGRPDAAIYADRTPLTTTGTTPAGSLDEIHYLEVYFGAGFCPAGYYVSLYRTNLTSEFLPVILISIPVPSGATEPPTGTIAATVQLFSSDAPADPASFEVGHFDLPPLPSGPSSDPLRIAGRVTANTGGWNVDFTLDALGPFSNCL